MTMPFQNVGEDDPSLTPINLHILRNLWLPDVEILDLKAFETHSVLSKLEGKDQIKRWKSKQLTMISKNRKKIIYLTFSIQHLVFVYNIVMTLGLDATASYHQQNKKLSQI